MSDTGKVTPITKNKKKKEVQPSKAEMYRILADFINGKVTNLFMGERPSFTHKYHVDETKDGERRLLVEFDDQIVQYSQRKRFKADVINFISENMPYHEVFGTFTEKSLDDFYKFWEIYTKPIKNIPSFRFKSDQGLCFSRMPFDPIPDDGSRCPLFKEICSRLVYNQRQFRAFIGSIFVPESDRQQYLWIKGEGLDGKGVTIRFLHKCLGPGVMNTEVPAQNDQFWNAILAGKRLICFPDCNNLNFPASPKFKMISGGDAIQIREMQKVAYSSEIDCKFLFASNFFPEISGQKSDQRRAIICEIDPSGQPMNAAYEDDLWEQEAAYVIGWCIEEYKNMCPNNEHIQVDPEVGEMIASSYEADVASVFNHYFIFDDDGFVTSREMDRVFRREFGRESEAKLAKLRRWLKSYKDINAGEKKAGHRGYKKVAFRDTQGVFSDCVE